MSTDHTRTLGGAVSGGVAAAVWALQQPLDKRLFDNSFDDIELLGKAITRSDSWYPAGLALHLQNGALLGAVYANIAPLLPLPAILRGPLFGLAEHCLSWPLGRLADRFHPDADELQTLAGNRRAFIQEGWRHLLYGLVLGELERRLNAPPPSPPPEPEAEFSSNGHGTLEHAVSAEPGS